MLALLQWDRDRTLFSVEPVTPRPQRKAMPQPDPVPSLRGSTWRRFRRMMRWMSLAAIVAAGLAVWFVARGESEIRIHMLIATALGAGLTVLLGAALMTLAFLSSGSGHDEEAHRVSEDKPTKGP
jgi:predicted small integral membrane protein